MKAKTASQFSDLQSGFDPKLPALWRLSILPIYQIGGQL
jgi:hypothetical protein